MDRFIGVQLLSSKVLDWRSRGCGFEPHSPVSLSKMLFYPLLLVLAQPRKTHADMTEKILTGMQRIKTKHRHVSFRMVYFVSLLNLFWSPDVLNPCEILFYKLEVF